MNSPAKFPRLLQHNNIVLKLYNWMDYPKNQFARNVEAFDENGNQLWTIEALDVYRHEADCYTEISSRDNNIHAFSFSCYDCVIDEKNGKIVSKKFTK